MKMSTVNRMRASAKQVHMVLALMACLTTAATGVTAAAQGGTGGRLLVLSKRAHTLSIVDPATLKVVGSAPVGDDPHEVIASADGKTAYVSNYGFGAFHALAVIDLVSSTPRTSIDLGALTGPHGLDFVDGSVWFTAEGAKAIGRYSPATGKVDLILGTGQNRTHMVHVLPGGEHAIVTNVSSGTVSLLDREEMKMMPPPPGGGGPGGGPSGPGGPGGGPGGPGGPGGSRKDWNETVIKVGNGSEGFDLSPDGREIWVGNAQDGTISVIDYPSKRVAATLQANVRGANRLKFTPDGVHVLVSTLDGSGLAVLDAQTRQVIKRVPIGHGAAGLQMQPDGARAYVACGPDNWVAVVDLRTLTVVGHIDAGGEPDGMAWAGGR